MIEKNRLEEILRDVKEKEYAVPEGTDIEPIIESMLFHIGYPEHELRDELIYGTFSHWIVHTPRLSEKLLRKILQKGLDEDHLFFEIGETAGPSVHRRTFSMLLIPLILINHRNRNFLSREEVLDIFGKVSRYFSEEKDFRGYLPETGWAHSIAHGADALDDLALCDEIEYPELISILEIIRSKVCIADYAYIDNEDERLVTAVMSIISREIISVEEVCQWIKGLANMKNPAVINYKDNMRLNIKNFLRSFYFRVLDVKAMEKIESVLKDVLKDLNRYR